MYVCATSVNKRLTTAMLYNYSTIPIQPIAQLLQLIIKHKEICFLNSYVFIMNTRHIFKYYELQNLQLL